MSYNDARNIIIQHYENPKYKVNEITKSKSIIKTKPTNCADNYSIGIEISGDKIKELSFEGNGCIVSLSSLDILLDTIKNSTVKNAIKIMEIYLKLIDQENPNPEEKIKNLNYFINIKTKQPNRLTCATNACKELLSFLQRYKTLKK